MKKLMALIITFGFASAFSAHAVETQCGVFHWSKGDNLRVPLIMYKKVVLDNGEVFEIKAPFVAVTEEATDAIATFETGDEVCFKANPFQGSSNKTFYVFSVSKKQQPF